MTVKRVETKGVQCQCIERSRVQREVAKRKGTMQFAPLITARISRCHDSSPNSGMKGGQTVSRCQNL